MAAKKKAKKRQNPPAKRSPRGSLPDWLVDGGPAKSSIPKRSRGAAKGSKGKQADESDRPERKLVHPPAPPEFRDASRAREGESVGVTSMSPLPAEPLRDPGRPTMRSAEIDDQLLDWLSCGGPLRAFCRLPGMPSHTTVHRWRKEDKAFAARYLQAKQIGYDELGEQCLEIADTPMIGEITEEGEGGGELGGPWSKVRREDMLGHRKLQIWTRLQLLAKWFPKKYGNKLDVDASGTITFDEKLRAALGLPALEKTADEKPEGGEGG